MKKGDLTGWKDIFTFTLIQTLKSKAYIISYFLLMTLMLVSMPLISMLTSDNKKNMDGFSNVNKIYVNNKTSFSDLDLSGLHNEEGLSHIVLETMEEDYNTVEERIEYEEINSIVLTIAEYDNMFSLELLKPAKGPIKNSTLHQIGDAITLQFTEFRIKTLGITQSQLDTINAEVTTKITLIDSNGNPIIKEDDSISHVEYWFIYGLLFAVLMVNVFASTQIATSIVTEKSSRVIEYLLISIKPLALMVGKIFAMLLATLLQIISMILILFISNSMFATSENGESVIAKYLPDNIFNNINLFNILICLVVVVLGMIFYAVLAGLTGATVSKIEEIGEGMTLFTFTNLIGAYMGLGAVGTMMETGMNGYVTFTLLFPLSSPFVLPGAIIIGKANTGLILGAIVLQVVFIVLLFKFAAKVYETLILHTGNKIKISELIKISKAT